MRRSSGHPIVAATLDYAMEPFEGIRREVVPLATGSVLEIGVGTGLNGPFYETGSVGRLVGIEPDPHMLKRARARYAELGLAIELVQCGAESIPFDDASFDVVVLTFVLCTIPDPVAAVAEMVRVLRPGGTLLFAEHTASDHGVTRAVQGFVNPVWGSFAGGCHLNRDAVQLLTDGGLVIEEVHGHGRGALNVTPVHRGVARRP